MRWLGLTIFCAASLAFASDVDGEQYPWLTLEYIEWSADVVRGGGSITRVNDGLTIFIVDAGTDPRELTADEARMRESVTLVGSLKPELIDEAASRSRKEVLRCRGSSTAKGFVVVKFIVHPKGGPIGSAYVLATTLDDAALEGCLVAVVKSWVFPPSPNGGVVFATYPFRFPLPSIDDEQLRADGGR